MIITTIATCQHDFISTQFATICCRCGADLGKLIAEHKKAMGDFRLPSPLIAPRPVRPAVKIDCWDPPGWLVFAAALAFTICAGLGFVQVIKWILS